MRHRFHALCPYFAMFPESFAERWISELTKPGDVVLDPFCGRGTAPFQALLMDREAIGNDLNPVAFCVTSAKTNAPSVGPLRGRLTKLARDFDEAEWQQDIAELPEFFEYAYNPKTLAQILYLRERLNWWGSHLDCMLAALVLGALHGEADRSPSYLSNQMRRTISTKPAYSVAWWKRYAWVAPERDAFDVLRRAITFRYRSERPVRRAHVVNDDMRVLDAYDIPSARCAITSPPYLDITDFEEDQWLRLWFLGGPPHPTTGKISPDDRHRSEDPYWAMIADMWRSLGSVLDDKANVVIRIGGRGIAPKDFLSRLEGSSVVAERGVRLIGHEVSTIRRRQTDSFRPGSTGCLVEVDAHFRLN